MHLSINQRFLLAFCLFVQLYSFNCDSNDDDKILSAKEAESLISNKLEQLSLIVHRKNEGDRIRKKRQFNLNYMLPGDEDEFSSLSIKTIVKDIEPLDLYKLNDLFKGASSWSPVENLANVTLFWTRKQQISKPYPHERTFLNYATLNPDLKSLQLHYSSPDLVQNPNSIAIKSKQFNRYNRYFIVLYSTDKRSEIVTYRFNPGSNRQPNPQLIRTQILSFTDEQVDFDLIKYQGNIYLSVSVNQGNQGEIRLYKWNKIQFDLVADQKSDSLAGVESMKLFTMSGIVYIATSTNLVYKDSKTALLFSYQDTGKIYDSLRLVQKMSLDNGNSQVYNPNLFNQQALKRLSKVESFTVHGNHYLVFIGPYDAKIFWWLKSQFIEFQKIPNTSFAKDIDVTYLPNNEAIISLVTFNNDLKFYTESVNGEFIVTFAKRFYSNSQLVKSVNLIPFRKTHYFALFTFTKQQSAYPNLNNLPDYYPIYHLNLTEVRAFKERTDPLMNCLDKISSSMKRNEYAINGLKQRTSDVWVRNRSQKINAPITVQDKTEVRSLSAINFMKIKSADRIPKNIRAVDIVENLRNLQKIINHHQIQVDTNLMLKNKPNQVVESFVNFVSPINGNNVIIDEITNPRLKINNVNLDDLTYKTLKRTGKQVIRAPYTFANNVRVHHLKASTLNNLNLNDILLSHSRIPQNVTGRYEFNNLHVNANIQLNEDINKLNLEQLVRINSQPVQVITGDKLFNLLDFKGGLQVNGLVNEGDVRKLADNAIKLNSNQPQICHGKLIFHQNIETNSLNVNKSINDRVNIDEMIRFGLRKEGEQMIQGNIRLNNLVTVNGDLRVDGPVNNLNLQTDLLNLHNNQVFDGELIFQQPIVVSNNLNAFMINSINFTNEVVYRNSPRPQYVISHKTFDQDLVINNNLTMKEGTTIDYVDPSELVRNSMGNVKRTFGSVTFDNLRVRGNVQTNRINEILMKDLKTKYWIKNYRQAIDVPVSIESPVKIQDLNIQRLNGHLFPSDYVVNKPNTEQLITGSKVFVNAAVLNGSFATSPNTKLNNLNLNKLDSRIVQNLQLINRRDNSTIIDYINGYKKFQTLEIEGNLYVNRLNGMKLDEDVLLRNSPYEQVISGRKSFMNCPYVNVKGQVDVGDNLFVRKSINKLNLNEWINDIVLKGTPDIINRPIENKNFVNRVDVGEINLAGQLSNVNFTNLISRAVYLDGRTTDINVPIIFNNPIQFNRVRLLGKLNNYDLQIYERSLIYKRPFRNQPPLIITGKTNIAGALTIESNLKSLYPLTTIDLGKLQSRMLSKTRLNVVNAPFVFEKEFRSNRFNLINPSSRINNISPSEFVRLSENITLPGKLVIEDALDIVNSLNVQSGSINQYNINELYGNAVNRFGNVRLGGNYGDVVFKYLDIKGNLHTKDRLLDDIHLENEYRSKVIDANNVIETPLIFTDAVSVGNLIIRNKINDVRFDFIINDAVLKSKPQNIQSTKVFIQDVIPNSKFTVHNEFSIAGNLNKARLDVLNKILIRKTIGTNFEIHSPKYFNKPVYFERDLKVAGAINKLRLPTDLVLSQRNEFINTTVVFKEPVEFNGQLNLLGTYNGQLVRKTLADRIDLNKHNLDNNPIRSMLSFNDKTIISELVVLKSINGIPIQYLIPTDQKNRFGNLLKGKFIFDGNVRIEGDLNLKTSVLNNIHLNNLATQSIRINSNDYLPGRTIIDRRLTFNQTVLNGKLNGIDLKRFRNYFIEKKINQENYYKGIMNNLYAKDQRLGRQVGAAFARPAYLEYFENYDEFDPLDANGRELIFDRFLTNPFVLDNQFDGDYIMHPTIEYLTAWRIVTSKNKNTKNANNVCSHYETWSYELNEYDDLVLQEEKIVHRAFPAFKLTFKKDQYSLDNQLSSDDENTFYLWSNTTGCHLNTNPYQRYAKENIPFEVTLLYTSQFTEIGKMKRKIFEPHSHKGQDKSALGRLDGVSAIMEDARFFVDKSNNHFAFVAFSYSKVLGHSKVNSTLFEFSQTKNKWFVRQQILSEGAVAVDIVHYYPSSSLTQFKQHQYQRITLMAIANRLSNFDQNRANVIQSSVYLFDDSVKQFKLLAQLPTYSPKSVLFLPIFKNLKYENSTIVKQTEHDDLFLIYANEKMRLYDECSTHEDLSLEKSGSVRRSLFNQGVLIYKISKTGNLTFSLHQKLDIVGSISLDKFYLPSNQAYIVVGSKILHKTFVYYYDRSIGEFVLAQTISTPSVENVKIFWSKHGNLYLAIASSKPGASKRLKAVINGPSPYYLKNIFSVAKY